MSVFVSVWIAVFSLESVVWIQRFDGTGIGRGFDTEYIRCDTGGTGSGFLIPVILSVTTNGGEGGSTNGSKVSISPGIGLIDGDNDDANGSGGEGRDRSTEKRGGGDMPRIASRID